MFVSLVGKAWNSQTVTHLHYKPCLHATADLLMTAQQVWMVSKTSLNLLCNICRLEGTCFLVRSVLHSKSLDLVCSGWSSMECSLVDSHIYHIWGSVEKCDVDVMKNERNGISMQMGQAFSFTLCFTKKGKKKKRIYIPVSTAACVSGHDSLTHEEVFDFLLSCNPVECLCKHAADTAAVFRVWCELCSDLV